MKILADFAFFLYLSIANISFALIVAFRTACRSNMVKTGNY